MAIMKNSFLANFSLTMNATLLMVASSYFFVSVNSLNLTIKQLYNETYMKRYGVVPTEATWTVYLSIAASCYFIGGFVGGLGMKFMLKIVNRKQLMQLAHMSNIVGVILIALVGYFTRSYEVIVIGRLIGGIAFGLSFNLPSLIVSETSLKNREDMWQSFISAAFGCGFLLSGVLQNETVLGSTTLWPVSVGLGAVPSIVYLIASWFLPNTPFYFLLKGNKDKALLVLTKLRCGNQEDIKKELSDLQTETLTTIGILTMLRKKRYRNQFIAVNLLLSNIVMGGIDTILLYSGDIFRNAGISESNIFYINIGAFSMLFICCFVGSFLVDRFGGYSVMVAGCVVLLCSQILFTVAQAIEHLSPTVTRPLAVVAVFLILGSWSLGINSSVFALLGEITTDRTRTTAYGYAAILFWILSWLGGFIPPYLILYARAYALAPWIIWTVMIIVYAIMYLPGVKAKTEVFQLEI